MASKYSKTYTRRKGSSSQITQFDKLLGDPGKSTHPIASKTAGHVGKWGTTSFTSLRSINGSHGSQDSLKRQRSEPDGSVDDAYNLDNSSATIEKPVEVKRRKFFKSRDQNVTNTSTIPNASSNHKSNSNERESPPIPPDPDKSAGTKHSNKSAATGIKLKIYKSRNTETTDVYSSKVELPSDESSNSSASRASTPSLKSGPNSLPDEELHDSMDEVTLNSPQHSMEVTLPESITNTHMDSPLSFEVSTTPPVTDPPKKDDLDAKLSEEDTCPVDTFDTQTESSSKEVYGGSVDLFGTDFDEEDVVDRTQIDYFGSTKEEEVLPTPEESSPSTNLMEEVPERPVVETFTESSTKTEQQSETLNNKKRSIFKSRTTVGDSKKRAMYRHKWHSQDEKEEKTEGKLPMPKSMSSGDQQTHSTLEPASLQRVQTWPSANPYDDDFGDDLPTTSVKCPKEAKKYYTVIKNVKKTHQLQESGEFQEFNDDVDYFLDALKSTNAVSTRCLASLNLAQKCMTPAFRMHLRAHGTVIKFFRALSDAHTHLQLGESVALVMYVLSQDHLNMDLDRESLELMLNLLDTDGLNQDATSLSDTKKKVSQLCKELQQKGYAKHLDLHNINASTLAMETLLSLTSKRAGEWFKEELRTLGGVEHLMRTVMECCSCFSPDISAWSPVLLEKLSKAERCLKVLENVTHLNTTNQEYLLTNLHEKFCETLMHLYHLCVIEVPLYAANCTDSSTLKALLSAHITTMKVLINLTHGLGKEALGSKMLGADKQVYDLTLSCLLVLPTYLDHDNKFEIQVLSCCLLLNLIENSPQNRATLMSIQAPNSLEADLDLFEKAPRKTAMEALIDLFHSSNKSALEQEAHTDQIIDQDLDQDSQEEEKKDEDIADTVARLLQKAGRHMEDTLIAAYSALLAGFCTIDNEKYADQIRELQPNKDFKTMVAVLKKFLHFMKLTATTSLLRSLKPTEKVVAFMENLDKEPNENQQQQEEEDVDFQ